MAFSPDGTRLLKGGEEGTATLWDAATGQHIRTFKHGSEIRALAFSPDGTRVLTGSRRGVKLWDAASGQLIHKFGVTTSARHRATPTA